MTPGKNALTDEIGSANVRIVQITTDTKAAAEGQ